MKKTLTAVAVLGALSGAAMATEVTLYGVVDTGFTYQHTEGGDDSFAMTSGNYAGPRFGFKGTEDLGDNLTLGFVLEAGFNSDTGAQGEDGKILNRESQIYLSGDWGTLGFGRVGGFSSGMSSLSWYWDFEPFETGYVDAGIQASQVNVWRLNSNTVYYISPVFAGFKFGAQYSFTGDADPTRQEDPNWSDNNNFANVALRWDGANARGILGVEWDKYGDPESKLDGSGVARDDAWSVKLVGAWVPNGGPVTLYAGASWYKNQTRFSDSAWTGTDEVKYDDSGKSLDGYSFFVGGKYTVGAADWLAMFQYLDGENKGAEAGAPEQDYKRYIASVGMHYHLSKRTMLYTIASFADGDGLFDEIKDDAGNGNTYDRFLAHVGITHFF